MPLPETGDAYQPIREAVRDRCDGFPDEYFRRVEAERGYPSAGEHTARILAELGYPT